MLDKLEFTTGSVVLFVTRKQNLMRWILVKKKKESQWHFKVRSDVKELDMLSLATLMIVFAKLTILFKALMFESLPVKNILWWILFIFYACMTDSANYMNKCGVKSSHFTQNSCIALLPHLVSHRYKVNTNWAFHLWPAARPSNALTRPWSEPGTHLLSGNIS